MGERNTEGGWWDRQKHEGRKDVWCDEESYPLVKPPNAAAQGIIAGASMAVFFWMVVLLIIRHYYWQ